MGREGGHGGWAGVVGREGGQGGWAGRVGREGEGKMRLYTSTNCVSKC